MRSCSSAWFLHLRRFMVDVLIGTAAVTIAAVAIAGTPHIFYLLLLPGVLLGIGLMLETNATEQEDHARLPRASVAFDNTTPA